MPSYVVYIGRHYDEPYDFWHGIGDPNGTKVFRTAFSRENKGMDTYPSNTATAPTQASYELKLADNEYPIKIIFWTGAALACRQRCRGYLILTSKERINQNNLIGDVILKNSATLTSDNGRISQDGNAHYSTEFHLPLSNFESEGTWTQLMGKTLALGKSRVEPDGTDINQGDVYGLVIENIVAATIVTAYNSGTITITYNQPNWGSATISNSTVIAGESATITITPSNSHYTVHEISFSGNGTIASGGSSSGSETWIFTMPTPAENVTIKISFRPHVDEGDIITKAQMDELKAYGPNGSNPTTVTQYAKITAVDGNTYEGSLIAGDIIDDDWFNHA